MGFWWETKGYQNVHSLKYLIGRKIPYCLLLILSIPAIVVWGFNFIKNSNDNDPLKIVNILSIILMVTLTIPYTIFGAIRLRNHFPLELVMFIFFARSLNYMIDVYSLRRAKYIK